jgi:hypothetical protein
MAALIARGERPSAYNRITSWVMPAQPRQPKPCWSSVPWPLALIARMKQPFVRGGPCSTQPQ